MRDGDKSKYLGKGVSKAVKNINKRIAEVLLGMDPTLQSQIDQAMIVLDKTENKARSLGKFVDSVFHNVNPPALFFQIFES